MGQTRILLHSQIHGSRRIPAMTLSTLLLIIVILALVGALPTWPHSRSWGYGPSGLVGVLLVVLLVVALLGRTPI
jgi:peptidoglycan/LPS O-acetylase OafA/YrhL